MKFEIEDKLLQKLIDYIATRPYSEVWEMIKDIQSSVKAIIPEKKEEPPIAEKPKPKT